MNMSLSKTYYTDAIVYYSAGAISHYRLVLNY
jgi:hypothetical protein